MSVGKYFWAAPLLAAENGQINEMQRSVECARINQSAVDTQPHSSSPIRGPQSPVRNPQSPIPCAASRNQKIQIQIQSYLHSLSFERARFLDFFDCPQTENNSKLFTDKLLRIVGIAVPKKCAHSTKRT